MDIVPVMVSYELFSGNKKWMFFRRHFLGTTRAGKSCTILNEDDIQLIYNVKDNTLQAFCNTRS